MNKIAKVLSHSASFILVFKFDSNPAISKVGQFDYVGPSIRLVLLQLLIWNDSIVQLTSLKFKFIRKNGCCYIFYKTCYRFYQITYLTPFFIYYYIVDILWVNTNLKRAKYFAVIISFIYAQLIHYRNKQYVLS